MAQVAHSLVVTCDGAFVTTIQLVFDCLNTKYFMTIHQMPGTKCICDIRSTPTFGQDKYFVQTFFFNRKCYVNAYPDVMQGGVGVGILSERKSSVERIRITWTKFNASHLLKYSTSFDALYRPEGLDVVRFNTTSRCVNNDSSVSSNSSFCYFQLKENTI